MTRPRAFGLPAALILIAFLVMLGFTLVSLSHTHLQRSNQLDTMMQADGLAESAAGLAVAKVMEDEQTGAPGNPKPRTFKVSLPGTNGWGRASFDAGQGVPQSVNNLQGDGPVPGYQRTVPPHTLQILGQGRVGAHTRLVEVVVARPPFKYALASSGSIDSAGGLRIQGIKDLSALSNGLANIPADQLTPGYVASNAGVGASLKLLSTAAQPTRVTGDAQCCGGIVLGSSTTVEGAVKEQSEAVQLPAIKVEDYDPKGVSSLSELGQGQFSSELTATGMVRRTGDLNASAGVKLDNGYLYVEGDLNISGGLRGRGAIFVTGNLQLSGDTQFAADSLQAILVKGDASLVGTQQNSSYLSGLVYTQGNLQARDLTMIGTLIGNKPGGSVVQVERANLIHCPNPITLNFKLPVMKPKLWYPTPIDAIGGNYYLDVVRDPALEPGQFFNPKTDSFSAASVDSKSVQYLLSRASDSTLWKVATPQAVIQQLQSMGVQTTVPSADLEALFTKLGNDRVTELQQQIADLDLLYQRSHNPSLREAAFTLDPNQFLQVGDKLRKVLWRHI